LRTLIAVSSCERDVTNGNNRAMRQTWIKEMPHVEGFDYKIFYGRGDRRLQPDEVRLDVMDDYKSLPYKTRESLRWALDHNYEFIFRAFTDTCINPYRLRTSGFTRFDYLGCFPGGYCAEPDAKGHYAYASGGPGYFLSSRAAEAAVKEDPDHWAEDLWIGDAMGRAGFKGHHDERFYFKWMGVARGAISVHLSRGTNNYRPEWMLQCFEQIK